MEHNEKTNTPTFRFPGFTDEWIITNLGEVADNIVVGFPFKGEDLTDDSSGTLILRGLSIGDGIIKHGGEYDKYYIYGTNNLAKYVLKENDIVIGMDGNVGKNIACVTKKEAGALLIQRVARVRITKVPYYLVYQQILSKRFKDYVGAEKVGGIIAHISQKQIEQFPILLPKQLAEQQKIASCLSSIDDEITAEQSRLEALTSHKQGLMQQLFPQEGQTTPSRRFPGFSDEWQVKILGDIASFSKGKGISKEDISENGQIPCIRYGELYTHYKECITEIISYTDLPQKDLVFSKANDVIIPSSGETQEDIATASCVTKANVALGGDLNIIRSHNNGIFLSYYLNSAKRYEIAQMSQGFSVVHLYNDQLKKLTLSLPSLPEQQKIADCLSSIDSQIAAQQSRIEALKQHKQGLMQKLFPSSL